MVKIKLKLLDKEIIVTGDFHENNEDESWFNVYTINEIDSSCFYAEFIKFISKKCKENLKLQQ
jgi:hypothetical protein